MVFALIPIALVVLYFATSGQALTASQNAKTNTGFWAQVLHYAQLPFALPVKYATELAKYIAAALWPAFKYAAPRVASFIAAHGQISAWSNAHAHRNSSAVYNTASWANTDLRKEITNTAIAHAGKETVVKIATTAPSVPVRRVTAKQNAVAFRHSFESEFPGTLARDYPQSLYTPKEWRKWLGVVPALGSIAVPFPRVIPKPVAIPKQGKINTETNRRLKRLEKILGITGLAGLIGATLGKEVERFLRCPNTKGIAKSWCASDLSGLLGLLAGIVAVEEGFSLVDFAKTLQAAQADVVNEILPMLTEFKDVTL